MALVTSHRNRPEGMSALRVDVSLRSFCLALPSWLLSYLYSTEFEESYRTEMPQLGKPAALPPRSTLKKKTNKKSKKELITTFTISLEKGMDFTLKLSLLCDLPTVLDFLMNADSQVKRGFFLTAVPSVIHTFWSWKRKVYEHADLFTFIASVAKKPTKQKNKKRKHSRRRLQPKLFFFFFLLYKFRETSYYGQHF